ncbi:hypothetical protein WA026_012402 [Henosepilachna vigintioctopunctata]|uniref:RRM domain-containing protein n=1 Tax=Henosepilachna vigintioctopunctata TaxID=420089 RepID=A0AAW1US50_9CUCU
MLTITTLMMPTPTAVTMSTPRSPMPKIESKIALNLNTPANEAEHHHIFVGDFSSEIETQTTEKAFAAFGEISNYRPKGYGLVSFIKKAEAVGGIAAMNGLWLGSRSICTNWATQEHLHPKNEVTSKPLAFEEVRTQHRYKWSSGEVLLGQTYRVPKQCTGSRTDLHRDPIYLWCIQILGNWCPHSFLSATAAQMQDQFLHDMQGYMYGQFAGYQQSYMGMGRQVSATWHGIPGQPHLATTPQQMATPGATFQQAGLVFPLQQYQLGEEEWLAASLLV